MRYIYLALVFAGIYYPWRHFYAWFDANGWELGSMIDAWYVNEATTALTWDLTIAAIALCVWVVFEAITKREWLWLIVIPVTFGIGVSAGLPLALLLLTLRRERTA
jgi:hypothetical protein